jgi:hypothetical protein
MFMQLFCLLIVQLVVIYWTFKHCRMLSFNSLNN